MARGHSTGERQIQFERLVEFCPVKLHLLAIALETWPQCQSLSAFGENRDEAATHDIGACGRPKSILLAERHLGEKRKTEWRKGGIRTPVPLWG